MDVTARRGLWVVQSDSFIPCIRDLGSRKQNALHGGPDWVAEQPGGRATLGRVRVQTLPKSSLAAQSISFVLQPTPGTPHKTGKPLGTCLSELTPPSGSLGALILSGAPQS